MTLHEAIVQVLKSANKSMTTRQIADDLNRTGAYNKKDGSSIEAFQIHGRTRNYGHLFERNGSIVSLKGKMGIAPSIPKTTKPAVQSEPVPRFEMEFKGLDKALMNAANFKTAGTIDQSVPEKPGLYCIRIKNVDAVPEPFNSELKKRNHNIIYIGIASQSLNRRMLSQELRANGHGTFFRSLGAVIGFRPPVGSLINKKNKRNYKFSSADEAKIISWINDNLLINWVEQPSGFEEIETTLITKYKPLINLAKNPDAMNELSKLRKECVEVANGKAD